MSGLMGRFPRRRDKQLLTSSDEIPPFKSCYLRYHVVLWGKKRGDPQIQKRSLTSSRLTLTEASCAYLMEPHW